MKKNGLARLVFDFSVDYKTIDTRDFGEKHDIVKMLGFIKQTYVFLALVMLGFNGSLTTKCVSMNSQPCMVRPMFIDLNHDELHYYPFIINLDRCDGGC